jgi:predicted CoA-binding protein
MALPANTDKHTDKEIRSFYDFKNIAIVGMSTDERKPATLYRNTSLNVDSM